MHLNIIICMHTCIHTRTHYTHIYMYICAYSSVSLSLSLCMYIYIVGLDCNNHWAGNPSSVVEKSATRAGSALKLLPASGSPGLGSHVLMLVAALERITRGVLKLACGGGVVGDRTSRVVSALCFGTSPGPS